MRISDWSSDVCSSDLGTRLGPPTGRSGGTVLQAAALVGGAGAERRATEDDVRMTEFSAWIGRSEERRDRLDASRSAVLLAAIGQPEAPGDGDPLPPLHHWLHFWDRSEEHTSELQSLMRISYAVFCLKKKKTIKSFETTIMT